MPRKGRSLSRFAVLGSFQGADRVPEAFEALGIGVAVLHDDGRDPLGMGRGQAVADRRAVVLDVDGIALETELADEALDELCEVIEAVFERLDRRRVAAAEARIVRGDEVIAVGQQRDQLAEHVRGGRETVQQEDGRPCRIARPAVKQRHPVNLHRAMVDRDGRHALRQCASGRRDRVHGILQKSRWDDLHVVHCSGWRNARSSEDFIAHGARMAAQVRSKRARRPRPISSTNRRTLAGVWRPAGCTRWIGRAWNG